jgi:hypothetical protein
MVCGAISESVPAFEAPQAAAHEKSGPDLFALLKNNTSRQPVWQEIVAFS